MLVFPGFGGPDRSFWPDVRRDVRPKTSYLGWFFVSDKCRFWYFWSICSFLSAGLAALSAGFWGLINCVQTRCIVKNEAQKSPLFLAIFWGLLSEKGPEAVRTQHNKSTNRPNFTHVQTPPPPRLQEPLPPLRRVGRGRGQTLRFSQEKACALGIPQENL